MPSPQSNHRATALQSISDTGRRQADTDVTVLNSDNAILFFVLSIMEISPERKFASSWRVECFLSVGRVITDHRYPTPAVCFPSMATRPLIGSDPLPLLSGRACLPAIQSVGFHLLPSSSSFVGRLERYYHDRLRCLSQGHVIRLLCTCLNSPVHDYGPAFM